MSKGNPGQRFLLTSHRLSWLCLLTGAGLALFAVSRAAEPGARPKEITNSIGMKLVLIPAGKFVMGSPKTEKERHDDEEQHEISITRPFYMGVHAVTQAEYEKVM